MYQRCFKRQNVKIRNRQEIMTMLYTFNDVHTKWGPYSSAPNTTFSSCQRATNTLLNPSLAA
jgi:hypothetical protein